MSVPRIPTPTVTPPAQGAVAAYIASVNAGVAIDLDPAHTNIAALDNYLTGEAKNEIEGNYATMKKDGLAYRGTPATPRVRVLSVVSPSTILLGNCPLASKTDPFIQYYIKTGRPVPATTTPSPPPPYLLLLNMTIVSGHWKLAKLVQDRSRTCTS